MGITQSNPPTTTPPNFESGSVQSVERKQTRAGKTMLTIKINQKDVSFFDEADVQKEVAIGDQVQFNCIQKGQYWNGKGLQQLHITSPSTQVIPPISKINPSMRPNPNSNPRNSITASIPQNPQEKSVLNVNRATLQIHNLSADQLIQLYSQLQTEGQAEPAFLGQISNQIRYARIEEMLRELIDLSKVH